MPELPEVETIRNELLNSVRGDKITSVEVYCNKLRNNLDIPRLQKISGKQIQDIVRRGKYLIFRFDDDEYMLIHLGMTGKLLLKTKDAPNEKHDHVVFCLKQKKLVYNDVRRFGLIELLDKQKLLNFSALKDMGPEPLSSDFSGFVLYDSLKSKRVPIKNCLLDQRIVSGLGNIYVCEALFRAGVSPFRTGKSITKDEAHTLCHEIKRVLEESIECGGTTFRDYRHSDGSTGEFSKHLFVYGRYGKTCEWCDFRANCVGVQKCVQSGRTTFYCPLRQK